MYVVIVYYVAFENNKRKLLKGCPFLFDNVNYVEHGFIQRYNIKLKLF